MKRKILFICLVILLVGVVVFILSSRTSRVEIKETIMPVVEAIDIPTEEKIWEILGGYDLTLQDKLNLMMIANCEGGFQQYAINYNASSNSFDLGHMQINTKFHPEVSRECSFNTECAIKESVRIYKSKGPNEWSCAKSIKFFKNK